MADLAALPRVDTLVGAAADLVQQHGRAPATAALRRAVDAARADLLDGSATAVPAVAELVALAEADLAARRTGPPRPVLNAAGVVVHTNLGRAPLSQAAIEALVGAAGYCDLEYDLATGGRGARGAALDPLLAEAAGADAALAVNNAAAALVLVMAALAHERDVAVSRGELVEIGGSFRLPDIIAASGARLVEVGTTNRTRATDYDTDGVALLLKVHPSNYTVTGFTEAPSVAELAAVARRRGVPLVHDVGSGLLDDAPDAWLAGEPSLAGSLRAGADLVLCSGDKLLGGPQAGILAGRADLVAACRAHPLARALRLDKLRIAALIATVEAHLRGEGVPVLSLLRADAAVLRGRCERLAAHIGGTIVEDASLVGGGAAPERRVPSPVVRMVMPTPDAVAAALRAGVPPIIARVSDGALVLDLRTVPPDRDNLLAGRVAAAINEPT